MVQEDQDICQRQVDQLAKALKTCYEAPSSPPISGFLKRDLARGKPPVLYTVGLQATIWNMNSSVWAIWAAQGSKEKKVDLSFSEQLLRVVFSTFCGQKKIKFKKKIFQRPRLKVT